MFLKRVEWWCRCSNVFWTHCGRFQHPCRRRYWHAGRQADRFIIMSQPTAARHLTSLVTAWTYWLLTMIRSSQCCQLIGRSSHTIHSLSLNLELILHTTGTILPSGGSHLQVVEMWMNMTPWLCTLVYHAVATRSTCGANHDACSLTTVRLNSSGSVHSQT